MTSGASIDWQRLALSSGRPGEGGALTDADGTRLEMRVVAEPPDVESRVRLVGYYWARFTPESHRRRAEHLAWLAEHRPDVGLGGFGTLIQELAPEGYEATLKAWRVAVARPDVDVRILGNAATFLGFDRPEDAEPLWRRAAEMDPGNETWRTRIAMTLTRRAESATSAEERRRLAGGALVELDAALGLTDVDSVALGIRIDLASAARLADDWDRARTTAERVLVDNESCKRTFQYGNAIHTANIVLGWAALADADVALASQYLVRAGKTPGSPQLNSFGPDRALARALLGRGEREAVLAYLADCARFWKGREALLEKWQTAIVRGEPTDLEPTYD